MKNMIVVVVLLGLAACASHPTPAAPQEKWPLSCDIQRMDAGDPAKGAEARENMRLLGCRQP